MPDLEKQIAEWRRQMLAAGIKSPVPLAELENHLREEIDRQMKAGLTGEDAFAVSIQRMGQPEILTSEFKKNEGTSIKKLGIVAMLFGAVIILRIVTARPDAEHLRENEQLGWLISGSAILIFGLRNLVFNSNSSGIRDVRRWRLIGITYSMIAVWISMVPILLFLTVPQCSAAVGLVGRILTFAALAVSFLSVFAWKMSRGILPAVPSKRTRMRIGIACCVLGPALAALFLFSIALQLHYSVGVILITWVWAAMAILGGVGYGLTEAACGQTATAGS
jgi:hypothetical protein